MRSAFRAHPNKTSSFAGLLKSGVRRPKISEAEGKNFAGWCHVCGRCRRARRGRNIAAKILYAKAEANAEISEVSAEGPADQNLGSEDPQSVSWPRTIENTLFANKLWLIGMMR